MKVVSATGIEATIAVSRKELRSLRNAINETLHGLGDRKSFPSRTGETVENALTLLDGLEAVCEAIDKHK